MNARYFLDKSIPALQRIPSWQIWLGIVPLSVVTAEIIVSGMEWLQLGKVTADYLLTGLVTSGVVASVAAVALLYLLHFSRRQVSDLSAILKAIPDLLFELDQNGKYVDVWTQNPELLVAQKNTLLGHTVSEMLPPEAAGIVMSALKEADEKGYSSGQVIRLDLPQGESWFELSSTLKATDDASDKRFIMLSRNITGRKHTEEALRRTSEEIEDLYEHAPCGYHSLDKHGLFIRMNHTELEWLGYRREEVVGKMRIMDLLTPGSVQTFQNMFPLFKRAGYLHDLEMELKRKDGTVFPVLVNATAIHDASGRYVSSRTTLFDLTERKKLEQELELQARIDMLTGLNNRRHFFELAETQVARAKRYGTPFSLLMLDVDNFKQVNDTYGHHIGDAALQKLSEVCRHTLREIDIIGRIGGEEFAALLPEAGDEKALEVAERLRQSVESAAVQMEDGSYIHFTVSIGVSSFREADSAIDAMLRRADEALYQAKNAGRNRVCCEEANMQIIK